MQQSQTNNDNMKDMIIYQIKVRVDKNSNRIFNLVLKRECKFSVELLENVITHNTFIIS